MTITVSLALVLALAPPPDKVPLSDTLVGDALETLTTSVIVLPFAPLAIEVVLVQVTVAVPEQLHPVPLALLKLKPTGNVVEKVSVPELALPEATPGVIVKLPVWPWVKLPAWEMLSPSTGAAVTVSPVELAAPPPALVTITVGLPAVSPAGTTKPMLVALWLLGVMLVPPIVSVLPLAEKPKPLIVTLLPPAEETLAGEKAEIEGAVIVVDALALGVLLAPPPESCAVGDNVPVAVPATLAITVSALPFVPPAIDEL